MPRTKKGTSNRPALSESAEGDAGNEGGFGAGREVEVVVGPGISGDVLPVEDDRLLRANGVRCGLEKKLLLWLRFKFLHVCLGYTFLYWN